MNEQNPRVVVTRQKTSPVAWLVLAIIVGVSLVFIYFAFIKPRPAPPVPLNAPAANSANRANQGAK